MSARNTAQLVLTFTTLGLLIAGAASAQEDQSPVRVRVEKVIQECSGDDCGEDGREVRVEVIKTCEGGDCQEGHHSMIFVGDDGEVHSVAGEGSHFEWSSRGDARAFLGVQMTELTPELRSHFGVPEDSGVMVSRVVENSPAFRAGLRVGDIISAVDSERVSSATSLATSISNREPDQAVSLEVWREGKLQTLSATLEKPDNEGHPMRQAVRRLHTGGPGERVIVKTCHGDDCESFATHGAVQFGEGDFDCPQGGECEVQVICQDGDCSCTVNGESAVCPDLP